MVKTLGSQCRVPCSKPLAGSRVDTAFHSSEVDKIPEISGNLVVKSKLPSQSGSSFEAVDLHPQKGAMGYFLVITSAINLKGKQFRPSNFRNVLFSMNYIND